MTAEDKRSKCARRTERLPHPTALYKNNKGVAWVFVIFIGIASPILTGVVDVATVIKMLDGSPDSSGPASSEKPPVATRDTTSEPMVSESERACRDDAGSDVDCSDASAWLVLPSASPCNPSTAVSTLGLDPSMANFELETKESASGCLARPSSTARKAEATALHLQDSKKNYSLLNTCLSSSQMPISCSEPHAMEFLTAVLPPSNDLAATCSEARRLYTGASDAKPGLTANWVYLDQERSKVRCVVQASCTLNSSVWQIRGNSLPCA